MDIKPNTTSNGILKKEYKKLLKLTNDGILVYF